MNTIPTTFWPDGESKGNRIRGSKNLADSSIWGIISSNVVQNTVTSGRLAPDGTLTANRMQLQYTVPGSIVYWQRISGPFEVGKRYTASIWIKNNLKLQAKCSFYLYKSFPTTGYPGAMFARELSSEWTRYFVSFVCAFEESGNGYTFNIGISSGSGDTSTVDMDVWGFQVIETEVETIPGPYVATDSLPVPPNAPYNLPVHVSSSPNIFEFAGSGPAELNQTALFAAGEQTSPAFGWNVGKPTAGLWKPGDMLVETTQDAPRLSLCIAQGKPGTWRDIVVGSPLLRVYDWNYLAELDGWEYAQNPSIAAWGPVPYSSFAIQDSQLRNNSAAWAMLVCPLSVASADGYFEWKVKVGTNVGPVLRAGTTTQGLLLTLVDNGNGTVTANWWTHGTGTWTSLALNATVSGLNTGDDFVVGILANGTTLSLYINHQFIQSWTSASFNTGGTRFGFRHLTPPLAIHHVKCVPNASIPIG